MSTELPAGEGAIPGCDASSLSVFLEQASSRGPEGTRQVIEKLYEELRKLAASQMAQERPEHTLQPTALVNEAAIRLLETQRPAWKSRAHFFAAAAVAMRRVLVDHARARNAAKRGGGERVIHLDFAEAGGAEPAASRPVEEMLLVDELLTELAALDERQAQIVEYKYFAGMTDEQIGVVLGLSASRVGQMFAFSRAWMRTKHGKNG